VWRGFVQVIVLLALNVAFENRRDARHTLSFLGTGFCLLIFDANAEKI
jgi:hypothetical protein